MREYNSINLGIELRDEDNQPSIIMEGAYTRMDGQLAQFDLSSIQVKSLKQSQKELVFN
jgi:hypothetical protein